MLPVAKHRYRRRRIENEGHQDEGQRTRRVYQTILCDTPALMFCNAGIHAACGCGLTDRYCVCGINRLLEVLKWYRTRSYM